MPHRGRYQRPKMAKHRPLKHTIKKKKRPPVKEPKTVKELDDMAEPVLGDLPI